MGVDIENRPIVGDVVMHDGPPDDKGVVFSRVINVLEPDMVVVEDINRSEDENSYKIKRTLLSVVLRVLKK